jgi:hypothetical protein
MTTNTEIAEPKNKSPVAMYDIPSGEIVHRIYTEVKKELFGDYTGFDVSRERAIHKIVKPRVMESIAEEIKIFTEDLVKLGFTDIETELGSDSYTIIFRARHVVPEIRRMFWNTSSGGRHRNPTTKNKRQTHLTIIYTVEYGEYIRWIKEPKYDECSYSTRWDIRDIQRALKEFIGCDEKTARGSELRTQIQTKETFESDQRKKIADEHRMHYRTMQSSIDHNLYKIKELEKKIDELKSENYTYGVKISEELKWFDENNVGDFDKQSYR